MRAEGVDDLKLDRPSILASAGVSAGCGQARLNPLSKRCPVWFGMPASTTMHWLKGPWQGGGSPHGVHKPSNNQEPTPRASNNASRKELKKPCASDTTPIHDNPSQKKHPSYPCEAVRDPQCMHVHACSRPFFREWQALSGVQPQHERHLCTATRDAAQPCASASASQDCSSPVQVPAFSLAPWLAMQA